MSCVLILAASQADAASRRHRNNPNVICGQKVDKLKTSVSPDTMRLADQLCRRNPHTFDPGAFAENNPVAVCDRKVGDGLINKTTNPIVQIGRELCLKNAREFDPTNFLKTNTTAVCERRVGRLRTENARASMLELAGERCAKVGVEFNAKGFLESFEYCDTVARRMTSLWTGYRRKARHDCTLMDDPQKNFNEANFIRANVLPPQIGATPKPTTDPLDN